MKNRQLITIVIFALLALSASACGGGTAPNKPAQNPTKPAATATTASAVGDPVAGKPKFDATCVACHGPQGQGVKGLGKSFVTSEFIKLLTDAELAKFIARGRPSTDPLNTTGVDMPPKGGNPALTDADLLNIAAFVRTLNK